MQITMERGDPNARSAARRTGGFDLTLGFEPLREDAFVGFLRSIPRYKVSVEKQERYPREVSDIVSQSELRALARQKEDPEKLSRVIQQRLADAGHGKEMALALRCSTPDGNYEIQVYDGQAKIVTFPAYNQLPHASQHSELRLFGDQGECQVFVMTGNNQSPPHFSFVGPVDSWGNLALLPVTDPERLEAVDTWSFYETARSQQHKLEQDWPLPIERLQEVEQELGRIRMVVPGREQTRLVEVSSSGVHMRSENSLDKALELFGGERDWTYTYGGWLAYSAPEGWEVTVEPDLKISDGIRPPVLLLSAKDLVSLRDSAIAENVLPGQIERITSRLALQGYRPEGFAVVVSRHEALPLMLEIDGIVPRFTTLDEDLLLAEELAED
jgi:hypothetical protein